MVGAKVGHRPTIRATRARLNMRGGQRREEGKGSSQEDSL